MGLQAAQVLRRPLHHLHNQHHSHANTHISLAFLPFLAPSYPAPLPFSVPLLVVTHGDDVSDAVLVDHVLRMLSHVRKLHRNHTGSTRLGRPYRQHAT